LLLNNDEEEDILSEPITPPKRLAYEAVKNNLKYTQKENNPLFASNSRYQQNPSSNGGLSGSEIYQKPLQSHVNSSAGLSVMDNLKRHANPSDGIPTPVKSNFSLEYGNKATGKIENEQQNVLSNPKKKKIPPSFTITKIGSTVGDAPVASEILQGKKSVNLLFVTSQQSQYQQQYSAPPLLPPPPPPPPSRSPPLLSPHSPVPPPQLPPPLPPPPPEQQQLHPPPIQQQQYPQSTSSSQLFSTVSSRLFNHASPIERPSAVSRNERKDQNGFETQTPKQEEKNMVDGQRNLKRNEIPNNMKEQQREKSISKRGDEKRNETPNNMKEQQKEKSINKRKDENNPIIEKKSSKDYEEGDSIMSLHLLTSVVSRDGVVSGGETDSLKRKKNISKNSLSISSSDSIPDPDSNVFIGSPASAPLSPSSSFLPSELLHSSLQHESHHSTHDFQPVPRSHPSSSSFIRSEVEQEQGNPPNSSSLFPKEDRYSFVGHGIEKQQQYSTPSSYPREEESCQSDRVYVSSLPLLLQQTPPEPLQSPLRSPTIMGHCSIHQFHEFVNNFFFFFLIFD
jgi:hypothetical protein